MSVNIRYPNITAGSEKEQLSQIKSYLHQLVEQLNYALPTLGTGEAPVQESSYHQVQGEEISYYELRSLIIQQLQEVDMKFEQLSNEYVRDEELPNAIGDALAEAKESGEFDGEDGYSPSITVIEIAGGHRVTITDATSTNSFDVMDGEDGNNGIDTVTETGTTNGWTYKKWSGGTYEMFGAFLVTTTEAGTAIGSMYRSEVLELPTPFAIEDAIVSGTAGGNFILTDGGTDASNITFALLRPDTFDIGTVVTVRLHATGTYTKEEQNNGNI